jgi:hypothetical protein
MKTLGMIGGMSWESAAEYYRMINQGVRARLGPKASAQLVLWSFDFSEIAALQAAGDWAKLDALMVDAALRLEAAGGEALVICTNTMHKCVPGKVQSFTPLVPNAQPSHTPRVSTFHAQGKLSRFSHATLSISRMWRGFCRARPNGDQPARREK